MSTDDTTATDEERKREVERILRLRPPPRASNAEEAAEPVSNFLERAPVGYSIRKRLGEGGMGELFLADHVGMERPVVLKVLKGDPQAASPDGIVHEAKALARLGRHPHVVLVYGAEHQPGFVPFMSMELIPGVSLEKRRASLLGHPKKAVAVVAQIVDGIAHAHANDVVHRDLKPENVMVYETDDRELFPIVIDFGLAKLMDRMGPTQAGEIKGSFAYMSPEQWDGKPVDARADVYSLGVMLFVLLRGEPPIALESPGLASYHEAVTTGKIRLANDVGDQPPIDDRLQRILTKCLQTDPARRYDAVQLRHDLRAYLAGDKVSVAPDTWLQRLDRWRTRHRRDLKLTFRFLAGAAIIAGVSLAYGRNRLEEHKAQAALAQRRQEQRREEAERQAQRQIEAAARREAARFLGEGRDLARAVTEHARSKPASAALLRWEKTGPRTLRTPAEVLLSKARHRLQAFVNGLPQKLSKDLKVENWQIFDAHGVMLARWPETPTSKEVIGHDLSGRDYFKGALEHARSSGDPAHVSLAYESKADYHTKAAVSVAVVAGGRLLGVLAASTATSPQAERQDRDEAVLEIAPFDPDSPSTKTAPNGPPAVPFVILVHPALGERQTSAPFPGATLAPLARRVPGHELEDPIQPARILSVFHDPLRDPARNQKLLIAAAPIGQTGFLAVVEIAAE